MIFFLLKGLFLHINVDRSHQKSYPRNNHVNQALALWSLDDQQVHGYGTLSFICCCRESLPTPMGSGRGSALAEKLTENSCILFFLWTMTLLMEHAQRCRSWTLHSPRAWMGYTAQLPWYYPQSAIPAAAAFCHLGHAEK